MKGVIIHSVLSYFIAIVWFINGLFCKILNLVPRHQEIVSRFFGEEHARQITISIGILEIGMAIWILSKWNARLNAITQILIITIMNVLEVIFVPDLLLWGRANAIFAFMFICLIYYNEFHTRKLPFHQS